MDMVNYIIQLLGGIDKFLSALIVFMVINYIAEIILVIVGEEKRSNGKGQISRPTINLSAA